MKGQLLKWSWLRCYRFSWQGLKLALALHCHAVKRQGSLTQRGCQGGGSSVNPHAQGTRDCSLHPAAEQQFVWGYLQSCAVWGFTSVTYGIASLIERCHFQSFSQADLSIHCAQNIEHTILRYPILLERHLSLDFTCSAMGKWPPLPVNHSNGQFLYVNTSVFIWWKGAFVKDFNL